MDVKYQRIKVIGSGSFGKAYLVKNTEEDKLCVVKQMETGMMDPKDRNEAVKEALFLKKMDHPNIIRFQEVFMTKKGRLCIVMEYADGGDVHSEIKKQAGELLPESRILSWFTQTCLALLHVHEQRVLHRDLKTQNIFLNKSGQIKLGDFGIARVLEATKDYAKTMVGTPYYLSPEIIQDKPYAYKSDVWSCGIVLYEMATLQHPFNADCLAVLAGKILQDKVPPLSDAYSPELTELIGRMLKKEAQLRPTFRDVLMLKFLGAAMHAANDEFKLGLDLSEFAAGTLPVEEFSFGPAVTTGASTDDAGGSGTYDDGFDADSADSGNEDATPSSSSLRKSVAALKLSGSLATSPAGGKASAQEPVAFSSKAAALRVYLIEKTSKEEFEKVQTLISDVLGNAGADMQKATESLKIHVSDLLGADRAEALLPMFQLLSFLNDVAASLEENSSGTVASEMSPSPAAAEFRQKESIMGTFKKWDCNADGFISKEELKRVLNLLGVPDAAISAIFTVADTNTDGKIDYKEFVDWLYSGSALTAFGKAPLHSK